MDSLLMWIFSWVCAQNVEHTWAPAGELLPMCQRCTGFYAGAAIALFLMFLFRPQVDSRYRWIHTILVLAMAPFGFHLVSHGPIIRTLSGVWFGFGVVGLLWLFPGEKFFTGKSSTAMAKHLHVNLGLSSFILLPAFARWGGGVAAEILPWLALLGLVAIAGLTLTNSALFLSWFFNSLIRRLGCQTT